MRSSSRKDGSLHGWWIIIAGILFACWFQGCATEADGVMPWSTPLPGEGSVPLPSGFRRE